MDDAREAVEGSISAGELLPGKRRRGKTHEEGGVGGGGGVGTPSEMTEKVYSVSGDNGESGEVIPKGGQGRPVGHTKWHI